MIVKSIKPHWSGVFWLVFLTLSCLFAAKTGSFLSPAQALKQAEDAYNKDEPQKVQSLIYSALKNHPFSYLKPELLLLLSASYYKERDFDQARLILTSLEETVPAYQTDPRAQILKSSLLEAKGQWAKAQGAVVDLKNDTGLYHSGVLLEKTDQSFAAVSKLLELKERHPKSHLQVPAQLALANSYFSLNEFEATEKILADLTRLKGKRPNSVRRYLQASAAYEKGDYQKALDLLGLLTDVKNKDQGFIAYARTLKGLAALKLGLWDVAEAAFLSNLSTRNLLCLRRSAIGLCGIYVQQGRVDKAIEICNRILQQLNNFETKIPFYLIRGLAYQHSQKLSQALTDFEEVARANHRDWSPKAYALISQILWSYNQYQRLTTDFYQSLKAFKANVSTKKLSAENKEALNQATFLVGEAYYALKNYKNAEGLFRDVLSELPGSRLTAQTVSGWVATLILQKKYNQAEQKLDELLVRFGEDRNIIRFCLLSQAHLFWNQEKFKDASQKYQNYAESFPDQDNAPFAMFQWGKSQYKAEEPKEAIQIWAKLRKTYPTSPYAFQSLLQSADVAKEIGDLKQSEAFYQEISRQKDSEAAQLALLNLSQMAMEANRFDESLKYLDMFYERFPASEKEPEVRALTKKAYEQIAYTQPQQLKDLAKQYKESVHAGEAWYHQGRLALQNKKFKEAKSYLDVVIKDYAQSPSAAMALFDRGKSEYIAGDTKSALVSLGQFVKTFPDHDLSYIARYYRGQAMLKEENPREALTVFQDLIRRDPFSFYAGSALLRSAEAHEKLKNIEGQMTMYHRFSKKFRIAQK